MFDCCAWNVIAIAPAETLTDVGTIPQTDAHGKTCEFAVILASEKVRLVFPATSVSDNVKPSSAAISSVILQRVQCAGVHASGLLIADAHL